MLVRTRILLFLSTLVLTASAQRVAIAQDDHGPEVRSFLEYMRHEEDELEFQIKRNEISKRDYNRSKTRIAIHRQTVLDLVRESGKDVVPELHVVTLSEVDQLIENGSAAIKTIKHGDIVAERWRYLGSVRRGEIFYIFERLPRK